MPLFSFLLHVLFSIFPKTEIVIICFIKTLYCPKKEKPISKNLIWALFILIWALYNIHIHIQMWLKEEHRPNEIFGPFLPCRREEPNNNVDRQEKETRVICAKRWNLEQCLFQHQVSINFKRMPETEKNSVSASKSSS